ncbi:hypothetical protein PINS_up014627 [Pythium insidiosum]|nr:hypothetical protein PINS_up014627 [Pythium insidiosum]
MPHDHVSFAAQSPYLVNATIQENILFGSAFNVERLDRVISACELRTDLRLLPDGLRTELGENGINLSGGQKQRVSMARAMYPSNQEVYIFDDALSALDAKVASRIFTQCFASTPGSLLAGQTRVLATHSLQFARHADWIIVMDQMRVAQMGTYEQLTTKQPNGLFSTMLKSVRTDVGSTDENSVVVESTKAVSPSEGAKTPRKESEDSGSKPSKATKLIEDESRATGSISSAVFVSYFRSCGMLWVLGAGFVLICTQLSQVSTDLWLTRWTSAADIGKAQLTQYLAVYAYLSLGTILLGFGGDLTSRFGGLSASERIHHRLLRHIVRGTMRFFDTTPIGRVLNRFSNDMNTIDQKLNASIVAFTTMLLSLISMLAIQCASAPLLLAVLLPVFWVYFAIQSYYRQSCRELQRLDSVTKSPIYAHFTETLAGLVTIRAFQMVDKSSKDQARRLNTNTKAFLYLNLINRWLGVRLEALGALITLGVACFVSRDHHRLSSAMAGLLLSYSQSITSLLNWIVRNNIDMENMMNSVERTDEYMAIDTEQDLVLDPGLRRLPCRSFLLRDRPSWPEHGAIQLIDVEVKYHAGGDLVLRGVSVQIQGGEKVGICGRTGAGKSSMLLTLFRLVRCHRGRILIDGVDISQLDLADLRSRMAIIPQEPVLFAASIRFNLDPTGRFDDATLWNAVAKAHLHDFISRLPAKLDTQVLEGGENFSLGERQLLCLARAILRRSKILCLDEATASMDHATDALIQRSVRQEFADATVLTIAHRVQTIADYDKVLVLHQGRVAEFGSPRELLAKPSGEFAAMMASGH